MKQFSYMLTRSVVPHARLAGRLIQEASRFVSSISVKDGKLCARIQKGGSVAGLNLHSGNTITITVDGRDEEAAVAAIQNYVVANL